MVLTSPHLEEANFASREVSTPTSARNRKSEMEERPGSEIRERKRVEKRIAAVVVDDDGDDDLERDIDFCSPHLSLKMILHAKDLREVKLLIYLIGKVGSSGLLSQRHI